MSHNGLVQRVAIFGTSGAGKTTLALRISEKVDLCHIEVDGIFHQANWTPLDEVTFLQRIEEKTQVPRWVTDGNYSTVRPLILARADTVVWLDYARGITIRRVVQRSLKRALLRQELWNGNREALSNLFRLDPEVSIICWSWTSHAAVQATMGELLNSGALRHTTVLRFRHPKETNAWLQGLSAAQF